MCKHSSLQIKPGVLVSISKPTSSEGESQPVIWTERFEEMGLPSFRPLYLFLLRIPLDVLHESLRLRLEQQPEAEPSLLSVRQVGVHPSVRCVHPELRLLPSMYITFQLIKECKEVLHASVAIRHYWSLMVSSIADHDDPEKHEAAVEDFEHDLQRMLDVSSEHRLNLPHSMACLYNDSFILSTLGMFVGF